MNDPRLRPLTEGGLIIVPLVLGGLVFLRRSLSVALILWGLAAAVGHFFRDPERAIRRQPTVALSPADGRVLHVERAWDDYWQQEMTEIAIFLALLDVHVQRLPLEGTVVAQTRRAGGYSPAMSRAATHGNNQLATCLETPAGPCTVTQISGLLARRIVSWVEAGDEVAQGQRLGMIKFGSQVTLRVPVTAEVLVEAGDGVVGGLTQMAVLEPADVAAGN